MDNGEYSDSSSSDSDEEEIVLLPGTLSAVKTKETTIKFENDEHDLPSFLTQSENQTTIDCNKEQVKHNEAINLDLEKMNLYSKPLLILDLNGFLFYREYAPRTPGKGKTKVPKGATRLLNFFAWNRPFVGEFLEFIFQEFDIGVWSSASKYNVDAMVKHAFGSYKGKIKFQWSNEYCTDAGVHPETPHKNLYLKELKKVWEKYPQYTEDNTLLIDDSLLKVRANPPHTAIHPNEWHKDMHDDDALAMNGDLTCYLKSLLEYWKSGKSKPSLPTFVQQHPYGKG